MSFLALVLYEEASINSPLLTTTDIGFTYLHLTSTKNVTISLKDRMAVLLDAQAGSYGFSINFEGNSAEQIYESFPFEAVTMTGNELTFFANKHILKNPRDIIKVPLWLVPKSLCNGINAVMIAEHHLSLNSTIKPNQNAPICLFSQIYFHAANVDAILNAKDTQASLRIYENSVYSDGNAEVQLDNPTKLCNNHEQCSSHYHQPFFMVINGDSIEPLEFNLHYEVTQTKPDIYYCEINSIAKILPEFRIKKSPSVFAEMKLKCESQANDILHIYKSIGIFLCILLIVGICLQCFNIVDFGELLCPDQEAKRFDDLKANPYAAELEEPQNDVNSLTKLNQ